MHVAASKKDEKINYGIKMAINRLFYERATQWPVPSRPIKQ